MSEHFVLRITMSIATYTNARNIDIGISVGCSERKMKNLRRREIYVCGISSDKSFSDIDILRNSRPVRKSDDNFTVFDFSRRKVYLFPFNLGMCGFPFLLNFDDESVQFVGFSEFSPKSVRRSAVIFNGFDRIVPFLIKQRSNRTVLSDFPKVVDILIEIVRRVVLIDRGSFSATCQP